MMDRINASTTYQEGCLTNGKPITEENIKELLAKFEEAMPTGSPWYGGDKAYLYYSPKLGNGMGCNSFAYAVSDAIFGKNAPMNKHQDFGQIKVGDIVWIKNGDSSQSHVAVITSLTNKWTNQYSTCDAGGTQGVSWVGHEEYAAFEDPSFAPYTWIYSRY